MDNNNPNIKERVLQIAINKHITRERFFQSIGATYGNFKGENKKTPLNSDILANILSIYPDINSEWLLVGHGEMFKSNPAAPINDVFFCTNAACPICAEKEERISELKEIISVQRELIEYLKKQKGQENMGDVDLAGSAAVG